MALWFLMSISKGPPGPPLPPGPGAPWIWTWVGKDPCSPPLPRTLGYLEASGNKPGGGLEGTEGRKAFLTLPALTQGSLACSAQGFSQLAQFGGDHAFRQ